MYANFHAKQGVSLEFIDKVIFKNVNNSEILDFTSILINNYQSDV